MYLYERELHIQIHISSHIRSIQKLLQEHYSDYIIANTNGTNVQISHLFA